MAKSVAKSVAIIGASNSPTKFGYKAVRAYRRQGWTVFPVNPNETTVDGLPAFASIAELPQPIDRISMYVPAEVGVTLLDAIAAARPKEFFLNPGTENAALVARARALGLEPILACSIVDIGERP